MGVQLPSEPITRKEQYLAKAAGQSVEVPTEPITREEAYLNAIAKGGGGGGTTNYNQLENKPQIGGVTLTGNKSASDLGLASATALANKVDKENGKGLSTNDFTDEYKSAIGDNTTAIEGIKDDLISVESAVGWSGKNILPLTFDNLKAMNMVGTWNDNVYTVNGVAFTVNMDSDGSVVGIQADGTATADASMEINMTLPTGSYIFSNTTNGSGASTTTYRVIVWESGYTNAVYVYDTEQRVNNYTPYKMRVVVINGYTASGVVFHPMIRVSTISDGTFQPYHPTVAESLTNLENGLNTKQNATDNNLQTTDKTIVGGINELRSGLINVNKRMVSMFTSYDASSQTFPVPDVSKPYEGQVMCAARNLSTGSIYLLWYDSGAHGFHVGAIVSGNAPSDGESVTIQYFS